MKQTNLDHVADVTYRATAHFDQPLPNKRSEVPSAVFQVLDRVADPTNALIDICEDAIEEITSGVNAALLTGPASRI